MFYTRILPGNVSMLVLCHLHDRQRYFVFGDVILPVKIFTSYNRI